MWRRTFRCLRGTASSQTPLEVFTQVQLGGMPPLSQMRTFLLANFGPELAARRISEAKVMSMDNRKTGQLLKQMLYESGLPRFTVDGPTESVVEVSFYHPESGECFSSLVNPAHMPQQSSRKGTDWVGPSTTMNTESAQLTGITDELLAKYGLPFKDVWEKAWAFLDASRSPDEGQDSEILLLSHGGKLADVSMLRWALEESDCKELPKNVHFGDTFHLLRDLHRKRPVTADKFPPSWNLEEVANWMRLPVPEKTHRAEPDAKLTWSVLYHSLDRYGDETLTPKQQLVSKFFDESARKLFQNRSHGTAVQSGDSEHLHMEM